jgi:glutamate-1-semialdehyde 2,1-aminomutase
VIGAPPLFDVVFTTDDVSDYRATLRANAEMHKRFGRSMRSGGILKGESKFYVSLAHHERDVCQTLDAFSNAIAEVKAAC